MKKKINYKKAPPGIDSALEEATWVKGFMPSPDELIKERKKKKITIDIDEKNLELYKNYAKKHNAKYQVLINDVLAIYAKTHLS